MPLFVGASESYDTNAWEAYNLKKENAKLRELVRLMLEFQNNPAYEYLDIKAVEARAREFVEQARELGVSE